MARPVAVYDANVLYPARLRDLLMWVAVSGLVRARWTADIHDEWIRNLADDADPKRTRAKLEGIRDRMGKAVRDALVTGYEHRIPGLSLPDPDDRHVLAAAIEGEADVIVTLNLKDFPAAALAQHGVVARHPGAFLLDLFRDDPDGVATAFRRMQQNLRKPPITEEALLAGLAGDGLGEFAAVLGGYLARDA